MALRSGFEACGRSVLEEKKMTGRAVALRVVGMGLLGLSGCWSVLGFEDEYTVAEGGSAGDASVGGSNVGGSGATGGDAGVGGSGGSMGGTIGDAGVGGSGGSTGGSGGDASVGGSGGATGGSGGTGGDAGVGGSGGSTGGSGGDASVGGSGGSTGGSGGTGGDASVGGSGGSTGGTGGDASVGGSGGATGGSGDTGGDASVGGSGGSTGGTGGSNVGGSGGTTQPCDTCGKLEECWHGQYCVAKKVKVTGGYAIDATEVTRDQYAAWLATNPSTSGQPSYCSWNADFTPGCEWPPGAKGNDPVVCVDWCDAYAYCAAVGKRLCGKIGGGANAYKDYRDPTKSQWYNACSSGGQNVYPYGDWYSESTCNGYDAKNGGTVPVGSMSGCESSVSGYTGVYDLSGNVWEWEDSCDEYVNDTNLCLLRGGSFNDVDYYLRCVDAIDYSRGSQLDVIGFRCCASLYWIWTR